MHYKELDEKKKKKGRQTDSLLEGKGRDREIMAARRGKAIESTQRGTTWTTITQDAGRLGGWEGERRGAHWGDPLEKSSAFGASSEPATMAFRRRNV